MVKRDGTYVNISGAEVVETAESVAAALMHWGTKKVTGSVCYLKIDPNGLIPTSEFYRQVGITVPIYGTLPAVQIEYIIKDSQMQVVFISNEAQLNKVLEIRNNLPQVRKIVVFDAPASLPDGVVSFSSVVAEGKEILKKKSFIGPRPGRNCSA